MMKVHIWLPNGNNVGHTAITIGNEYISFWPADSAGKKDLKLKRSQPGSLMESMKQDIAAEGGHLPITIDFPNVDKEAVLDYLTELKTEKPRYQITRHNCSHVAAKCIELASNQVPSFVPQTKAYGKIASSLGSGIWTPDQVLKYAKEIIK